MVRNTGSLDPDSNFGLDHNRDSMNMNPKHCRKLEIKFSFNCSLIFCWFRIRICNTVLNVCNVGIQYRFLHTSPLLEKKAASSKVEETVNRLKERQQETLSQISQVYWFNKINGRISQNLTYRYRYVFCTIYKGERHWFGKFVETALYSVSRSGPSKV